MGVPAHVPMQNTAKFKNSVRLKDAFCIHTEHTKGVLTFSSKPFEALSKASTCDSNLVLHRENDSPREGTCSVQAAPAQKTIIRIAVLSSARETFHLQAREKGDPEVLGHEDSNTPARYPQPPKQAINSADLSRTHFHTIPGSSASKRLPTVSPETNSSTFRIPRGTASESWTSHKTQNYSSSPQWTSDTLETISSVPRRTSYIPKNIFSVSRRTSKTARNNSSTERIPELPAPSSSTPQRIPDPPAANSSTPQRAPAPPGPHEAFQVMGPSRPRWSLQKRGTIRSSSLRLVLVVLLLAACKVEGKSIGSSVPM